MTAWRTTVRTRPEKSSPPTPTKFAISHPRGSDGPAVSAGIAAPRAQPVHARRRSVGGNAPNAERRKIASYTTEVTSISTEPIPDSIFEIPRGYTVTRR